MAPRALRATAYHEAGHAVACHFFPLSGKTTRLTIHPTALAKYNSGAHPVNEAFGLHSSGRTLSAIVGKSIDRDQLHHAYMCLLAGYAAGWIFKGDLPVQANPSQREIEEALEHSDGGDDFSRVIDLLYRVNPYDMKAPIEGTPTAAVKAHTAQIREEFGVLWEEALEFTVSKWAHIQALSDALWRKRTLSGEEATASIERTEGRIHGCPALVLEILHGSGKEPSSKPTCAGTVSER